MSKFKIGDRVRVNEHNWNTNGSSQLEVGRAFTIASEESKTGTYRLVGFRPNSWWNACRFDLVEEPVTFRPGDCVRRVRNPKWPFTGDLPEGLYIVERDDGGDTVYVKGDPGNGGRTRAHFELVARGPEPEPEPVWSLGEFTYQSHDTPAVQAISHTDPYDMDRPKRILVRGASCKCLAKKIVDFLNKEELEDGT